MTKMGTVLSVLLVVGIVQGANLLPKIDAVAVSLSVLFHFLCMFSAMFAVPVRPPQQFGPLRFQVTPTETLWLERLRVKEFGQWLDCIGWNRLITEARAFGGRRGRLAWLAEQTWRSEIGHAWALCVTVLVTGGLAFTWPVAAVCLLGLALPFHLYPIGLQRALRQRIQLLQHSF